MKRIVGLSLFIGAFGPTPLLPILPNRYYSIRWLQGLRPRAPAYFSLAGKVGKRAHRGGTLSMGSLPCEPLPHDDTKGGARPPFGYPRQTYTSPLWIPPPDLYLPYSSLGTPEGIRRQILSKSQSTFSALGSSLVSTYWRYRRRICLIYADLLRLTSVAKFFIFSFISSGNRTLTGTFFLPISSPPSCIIQEMGGNVVLRSEHRGYRSRIHQIHGGFQRGQAPFVSSRGWDS